MTSIASRDRLRTPYNSRMPDAARAPITVLAGCAAVLFVLFLQLRGTEPAPAGAPTSSFSAARAIDFERQFLRDVPHPAGSAEHEAVRLRIIRQFETLGYDVRTENAFACNAHDSCAPVSNVLARRREDAGNDRKSVLLAAHYDSVGAGPGASDDGAGVATILEIARAVRRQRTKNPIVFLIDDAEESGLVGAEAFVRGHDARGIGVVINLEARGTTGPAFLFETSRGNRRLLPVIARSMPHPLTSSLFATIYDLMPNDTDLTVFKRNGFEGVNLAWIGGVQRYHTPLDDLAHVDLRSMQQRGDSVLAITRAFAREDFRASRGDDAVWFDLLGFAVCWWPARWTLLIALATFTALIVLTIRDLRAGRASAREIAAGAAMVTGSVTAAAAIAFATGRVLQLRDPASWVAHPAPAIVAMWATGIAMAAFLDQLIRRRARAPGIRHGAALVWSAGGLALAASFPGASYVLLVPAIVLVCALAISARFEVAGAIVQLLAVVTAAALLFPFGLLLYDALGALSFPLIAAIVALVLSAAAGRLAGVRGRIPLLAATVALVAFAVALMLPSYSSDSPRRVLFAHETDGDRGTGRWITSWPVPPEARFAFDRQPQVLEPWYGNFPSAVAASSALTHPAVEATLHEAATGTGRVLTIDLRSLRGASQVALAWKSNAKTRSLRINGITPPDPPARFRQTLAPGWQRVRVEASSARIEIHLGGPDPVEAVATDSSSGLPPSSATLFRARQSAMGVPSHEGDVTRTIRHYRW